MRQERKIVVTLEQSGWQIQIALLHVGFDLFRFSSEEIVAQLRTAARKAATVELERIIAHLQDEYQAELQEKREERRRSWQRGPGTICRDRSGNSPLFERWNDGAEVLLNKGKSLSSSQAITMFLAQYEHALTFGRVSLQEYEEACTSAKLVDLMLTMIIRYSNYAVESEAWAREEMRKSERPWLHRFADCLEQQDYRSLSLLSQDRGFPSSRGDHSSRFTYGPEV